MFAYPALLDTALAVVIAEPVCVGGVTAMRRVADMSQLRLRGFAAHDCGGPVNLAVDAHIALHAQNAVIQEISRANYYTWYGDVAEGYPIVEAGLIRPVARPGHGVTLRAEFRSAAHVVVRESKLT